MYGNPMKPRNIIYLKYTRPGKHPQNYGKIMKDPPLKQWVNPCKSTISTGPFSIAMWKKNRRVNLTTDHTLHGCCYNEQLLIFGTDRYLRIYWIRFTMIHPLKLLLMVTPEQRNVLYHYFGMILIAVLLFFFFFSGGDHINIVKRKQLSNQPTNQSLLVTRSQVGRASASSLSPGPYHLGVKEDPSPHRASDQSQNQPCQQ